MLQLKVLGKNSAFLILKSSSSILTFKLILSCWHTESSFPSSYALTAKINSSDSISLGSSGTSNSNSNSSLSFLFTVLSSFSSSKSSLLFSSYKVTSTITSLSRSSFLLGSFKLILILSLIKLLHKLISFSSVVLEHCREQHELLSEAGSKFPLQLSLTEQMSPLN